MGTKETRRNELLEKRIAELDEEINSYRQAIEDAEGALDSAEKEMNELLSELNPGFI